MENEGLLIGTWQPAMEDFSLNNQADNEVFWDMADPLAILHQVEAMRLEDSLERLPRSSSVGNNSETGKPYLFDYSHPLSSVMRVTEYLDAMVNMAMERLPLSPPMKRMVQYISPV